MWIQTDIFCVLCLGKGKGMANMDCPSRKMDSRRPSVCLRCGKAMVAAMDKATTESVSLFGRIAETEGREKSNG